MKKAKTIMVLLVFSKVYFLPVMAQTKYDVSPNTEIFLSKDTARKFFGIYEFNSDFKMKIYSGTTSKLFAQRVGDPEKFQIFPKQQNVFFLKTMTAELEFLQSTKGNYDILVLHQDGRERKAVRVSYQPYELFDTIMKLDSDFYNAYNNRDLKKFMSYLSPDLEFYHDLTGLTDYEKNLAIFKEKFADSSLIMRRELVPESAEVYPIKGLGAVEIGTHKYYVKSALNGDRLASQPKFVLIWKNVNGRWQIIRIISYEH